jgi:hypothetical protein
MEKERDREIHGGREGGSGREREKEMEKEGRER